MRKLTENIIQNYLEAGEIASNALKYAYELVKPKKRLNLYELCESVEGFIKNKGAAWAFPCNVSLNEIAAHYSPLYPDDEIVFDKGLLKVDTGAMINGYIADTAITISRGYEYEKMAIANREIHLEALRLLKPGVSLGSIGEYIESRAKMLGYKPISNLSGHLLRQYILHAGKSVPNVKQFLTPKIEAWEVYAVEPFFTFGDKSGEVVNMDTIQIYSLSKMKRIKDKVLNSIKEYIYNNFRFLPFSPRWLYKQFGDDTLSLIDKLYKMRYLHGYPTLVERTGGYISQFEHTVIVTEDTPIITTLQK